MKRLLVALLLAAGCADIRVPVKQADGHLKEIRRVLRTSPEPATLDRERISFHAGRGLAWTGAVLEIKGHPPAPLYVPDGPADLVTCKHEDRALSDWRAEAEADAALGARASGWLGKFLGIGAGGTGVFASVMLALRKFMRQRETIARKDAALDEYDQVVEEEIGQARRRELGAKRPAMSAEHLARKPQAYPAG